MFISIEHEEKDVALFRDEEGMCVITLKNELGLFENPYRGLTAETKETTITSECKDLMRQLASESIILLKNNNIVALMHKNWFNRSLRQRKISLSFLGNYWG